ncbi:MAG: hypothetical protein HY675_07280 [Chloroflexi bacterium]|nr:hypothetical protein [Chloroflexota bacterium]
MEHRRLELAELVERLRWLVALRWMAVACIVAAPALLAPFLQVRVEAIPILAIAGAIGIYNAVFWFESRDLAPAREDNRRAIILANLQIALDLVSLTVLLHYLGSIDSPFYLYFTFHVIIASILLSPLATYLQATLAVSLFSSLAMAEYIGIVPHISLDGLVAATAYRQSGYVALVLVALASTLYLSAYVATSIVGRLRVREREIIRLKEALQSDNAKLMDAYKRLQETEQFKSLYLRKVSHELRAPLGSIQSLLAVVSQGFAGPLSDEAGDLLQRVSTRTQALIATVNELLILSRAREIDVGLASQEVAVGSVVRHVLDTFEPQTLAKSIELQAVIRPNLPAFLGDGEGIQELVSNLVSNAIKYTPPGGKVSVRVDVEGTCLAIRVADTGIGIDAEELPRVFDEFYRSRRAREFAKEGTGLGLSIARAVVEAHGGQILVESGAGRGSCFTAKLPLQSAAQSPAHGDGTVRIVNDLEVRNRL